MITSSTETTPEPSEAVTRLWIHLMRTQRLILAAIEQDLKAAGMPPLAWYDVLWELVRTEDGRLRPFEIEERTLLAQHNLSRLLDRMEEAGLVRREILPEDGRGRWVLVTGEGRAMRARLWTVYAAAIERHLGAKVEDAVAATLADGLERLVRGT
ncbi:MarR family transcriptional regulator [Shinella sp. CPCC 101442]|uniref:MarR family winged helix-turn-helix transcriptional regulator n=1 Tax=Shinella sp. CPCC 101442 TaxID=2932265 RepID=UPI002152224D|nr:MarR family winged helix-turn-helix transcriptional regulator [Shinella sp. CPCC 101442]MCR6498840.1 MarR family transcriptional regulator [Shinella sp. CPCC 101442]